MSANANVFIETMNRAELRQSVGARFADAAERELWLHLQRIFGDAVCCDTQGGTARIHVGPLLSTFADAIRGDLQQPHTILKGLLHLIGGGDRRTPSPMSLVSLRARLVSGAGTPSAEVAAMLPATCTTPPEATTVREVDNAMADGRLLFKRETIHSAVGSEVLYLEMLARIHNEGRISLPGTFIPALEKLGLMRPFDQFVLACAIETLRTEPELTLGCNISGQSARNDAWWETVFKQLEACPDIASRLVVELTETTPVPTGKLQRFARRLRSLGCRIAIDDFGAGFGRASVAEMDAPDIIKIDRVFIADARQGNAGRKRLERMVSVAAGMAEHVVVEGVETQADLDAARATGAQWVQGYYFGSP